MGASHVFSGGNNSVWWLGLIAFSKLLSPSHAQQSISLYRLYKEFIQRDSESQSDNDVLSGALLKEGFSSFSSNRFDRLPELSSIFTKHFPALKEFFARSVDENTNKLVLACFTHLESDWFKLCCEVASNVYKIITQPMEAAIGIEENKIKRSEFRSWSGLKILFEEKLAELGKLSLRHSDMTSKEHLMASAAGNIRVAMERQLKYVDFYNQDEEEISASVSDKLKGAPLTNSGCESQFGELDNYVKKFGGTASVSTLSDKHVIKKNTFFESENWKVLSFEEKKQKFAWARGSSQAN